MEVIVPEASGPGQLLSISAPSGRTFEVTVPDGCAAGEVFSVQLPEDDKAPPEPLPPPPEPLQVVGLTEGQVVVLRACLLAIEDSKACCPMPSPPCPTLWHPSLVPYVHLSVCAVCP